MKNSIIAQGCVINGEVENCVISKGVYVGEGAKLSNCIVMQDTKIGCNTNLNYVIIDKDVTIKDGRSLMGYDSYPIYIAKKYCCIKLFKLGGNLTMRILLLCFRG